MEMTDRIGTSRRRLDSAYYNILPRPPVSIHTVNVILGGYANLGSVYLAFELFEEMRSKYNLVPNTFSHIALLRALWIQMDPAKKSEDQEDNNTGHAELAEMVAAVDASMMDMELK